MGADGADGYVRRPGFHCSARDPIEGRGRVMNIILPILFSALAFGLLAKRMTWREWIFLTFIILIVTAKYYVRGH